MICYEFTKLLITDIMAKRYLRSYLSSAILIAAFETLVNKIIDE